MLNLAPKAAGKMLTNCRFGAMVGRFVSAYVLTKENSGLPRALNTVGAVLLIGVLVLTREQVAMWRLLAVGLLNSIMFATISILAVAGLGRRTSAASGLLNVAIVGGAVVPMPFGPVADASSRRLALLLPAACYVCIMWYGLRGHVRRAA